MILSGKQVAERIFTETKGIVAGLAVSPGLGVVLVGDDPASRVYVGIKECRAGELGFVFRKEVLSSVSTEDDVIGIVNDLNADPTINGIIVQLPLPAGLDTDRIIAAIDPAKDADGFHPDTVKRFLSGDRYSLPVFPEAIMELAKSANTPLSGKRGIVIANSELFGDIMTKALEKEGVSASVVRASDIDARIREIADADIVVTAIGQHERFPRNVFKQGAIVIDGGISEKDGRVRGDVSPEGDDAGIFLTPVPGGVGPVTVACLLRRAARLTKRSG